MDLSPSDFSLSSDFVPSNYNLREQNITPIAIFLILILLIILVIFYVYNFTTNHFESVEKSESIVRNELIESVNKLSSQITNTNPQEMQKMPELANTINNLKSKINLIENKLLNEKPTETSIPTININSQNEPNNYIDDVTIYDPIANYDRLKLSDPLVDPRGRSSADQIPTPQVAAQLNFPTQGVIDRYHRVGLLIALDSEPDYSDKTQKFNFLANNKNKNKINSNYSSLETKYRGVEIVSGSETKSKKSRRRKSKKNNKETFDTFESFDTESDNSSDYYTEYSDNLSYENFSNSSKNNLVSVNYDNNNILELIGKKITDNWYKYFTSISIGNKIIKITVHNRNRKELYDGDIVYIHELKKNYKVQIDPMDMIEYNPYFF
jgi:hypothetical protein